MLIRLGIKAATTVVDRGQRHLIRPGVIQKTPVSVMPVPVSDKSVHDKHIPKTLNKHTWVHDCLLLKGQKNIGEFRPISVPF